MSEQRVSKKSVLVIGAYGFIGASVTRALRVQGFQVTGMVRNAAIGRMVLSGVALISADLRDFHDASDWDLILPGIDAVVNCAGALQDGPQDDLEAVQNRAMQSLGAACSQRGIDVIQISAIGAEPGATTAFMRTKAAGDAALRNSGAPLWIFKPGLVIGQNDYGGTALLRMLSAVPLVLPLVHPDTPVQCVGMQDLTRAVVAAVRHDMPRGTYDLVEDTPHPLSDVVQATRSWLGYPPARHILIMPVGLVALVARVADGLAWLGWRSPLRSTAMVVIGQGVTGNPAHYRAVSGTSLDSLADIFDGLSCGREHRLAARISLLMPFVVATLCLFWVLSGVVGLTGLSAAAETLTREGWGQGIAITTVVFWSVIDILLGLAILWRPWSSRACLAQAAIGCVYLATATIIAPYLWADPLGPLVKILPATMLSLAARPMLESR